MPTNTPENACFRNAHQSPPARSPLLLLSDSAARDFDNESADRHYDSVVVGLAPEKLSYDHLNRAYRILKAPLKKEKALIATHKVRLHGNRSSIRGQSRHWSFYNSKLKRVHLAGHLLSRQRWRPVTRTWSAEVELKSELCTHAHTLRDLGPFVQALEEAADVKAEVVGEALFSSLLGLRMSTETRSDSTFPTSTGKPTQSFFELCLRSLEQDGVSNEDWSSVAVVR